ncbi:MAG: hypothetical protein ACK5LJ_15385 [Paracoccus sp. (in: a-proteobacteria)]
MRSAAMILGFIGGICAMMIGFSSFSCVELSSSRAAFAETFGTLDNPGFIRIASFLGLLLAIAGGAMAVARALWGGIFLLIAAGLLYAAFGFNAFTMFPIGLCLAGGFLALVARRPDEPKSHF